MSKEKLRPTKDLAYVSISDFIKKELDIKYQPHFSLVEDGDTSWAFWINDEDSTSYFHHDLKIEWCGTSFDQDTY